MTFHVDLLPTTRLCERVEQGNLRGYKTDSTIYPSITSVLGVLNGEKYKNFPKHLAEKAARRGTLYHTMVEEFLLGANSPVFNRFDECSIAALKCFKTSRDWLAANVKRVLALEAAVYSDAYKIAGTMDLLVETADNRIAVVDHKTSSRLKKLSEMESYVIQLFFYGEAVRECYGITPDVVIISLATVDKHCPFVLQFNKLSNYSDVLVNLRKQYLRTLNER